MITVESLRKLLTFLNFTYQSDTDVYYQEYECGGDITVDFHNKKIIYNPIDKNFNNAEFPSKNKEAEGFVIHRDTTLNFSANENFVCLVCVHLLLQKGYEPKHIVFEPAFKLGHVNKPSYGDILVFDKEYKPLVLIENKTYGKEFSNEWNNMQKDGGQLFSYLPIVNTLGACESLVLFAADFEENLIPKSHIITLRDNEKRISELESPKTFANNDGKYFDVWNETYAKSFETKGLFEADIEPYTIGKAKYTINDLKELSHAEIRPIYHEFATILRNHAITDFEHSFYILIDLFLCKITDERNNPDDLQFYYKGITRDTPKEYCARLLKLYQLGKKQLFDVDIINKEESDIEQIFFDKNRVKNGLFTAIKELFEEIKFYNIKKFNFIDVENKEEFEMNFQILIKISALIQDINLSNSETNHFFGDLFEGLLSKNVHQTEGQFFTPLPIVNFIIKALPEFPNSNSIKVLDYACGAGHFLTEFVKSYPQAKVYGIEKSQPLSQVAKIAAIINGSKESHIAFKDSLSILNTQEVRFQGFDKDSFDCIIANPPYSVKGFLNTMTENDRNQFELTRSVEEKAYDSNKSIECFFVERSKHFLKQNGFMAIVLPSSVLSNGNLYIKVRELLFAHFNILAIVNLGSRTFGSTGTNTIVLFAQKVAKNSEGLLHTFIEKKDYTQYLSYEAIDSYIDKQGYNRDDYFSFMQDNILIEGLENNEIFVDYKKSFTPNKVTKTVQNEWFKTSTFFDSSYKEKSKEYKILLNKFLKSDEYKTYIENNNRKQFIEFAKKIECDKLNTFIQIENNVVAILQSPPDKIGSKSNKSQIIKFLGYDWSNRKGDEGIKYITNKPIIEEDDGKKKQKEDSEDKDAEIVNAINSIKFIETPLYNPDDGWDNSKFAFAIRKHILNQSSKMPFKDDSKQNANLDHDFSNEMEDLLSYAKLSDLIDFSSTNFEKAIKTSVTKKVEIESKYELVKLKEVAEINKGVTYEKESQSEDETENVVLTADNVSLEGVFSLKKKVYVSENEKFDDSKKLKKNDCFICFSSGSRNHVGKVAFINEDTNYYAGGFMGILRSLNYDKLLPMYLYEILNKPEMREVVKSSATGSNILNLSNSIVELKIPLPPKDIQEKIVSECEKVDEEYTKAQSLIENCKLQIEKIISSVDGDKRKIGEVCKYNLHFIDPTDTPTKEFVYVDIESVINGTGEILFEKKIYGENAPSRARRIAKKQSTLVSTVRPNLKGFAYLENEIDNAVYSTGFAIFESADKSILINKMIYYNFMYSKDLMTQIMEAMPKGQYPSINSDDIDSFVILVPPLSVQQEIVGKIEKLEQQISEAKNKMQVCSSRKQEILDKYLK